MLSSRRLAQSPFVQKTLGVLAAEFLRLTWWTNRLVLEPEDFYQKVEPDLPVIVGMWHGQHFMTPFFSRGHKVKVLISRHRDGEINAIAAERLGVGTIRGSGAHSGEFARKGGVGAFKEMLSALQEGYSLALTADVPKVSRIAGRGIVMLARVSRRPILPVAVVTSRRIELKNWDRSTIGLPFGRAALVAGDLIRVPETDTDNDGYRKQVEDGLNAVMQRSYEIADRRDH